MSRTSSPTCHSCCNFGWLRGRRLRINTRFGGECGNSFLCCLLRSRHAALPAVDTGEGDAESLCELFLREVKIGTNGA